MFWLFWRCFAFFFGGVVFVLAVAVGGIQENEEKGHYWYFHRSENFDDLAFLFDREDFM
jgi:hypothetical protein